MIKIIFGVYGDNINAQDINGIEIASRLGDDFESHIFCYNKKRRINGLIFHKTTQNRFLRNICKFFVYLFGNFDIYYMPRLEKIDLIFARLFGKKKCIISSLEIENALHSEKLKRFFCNDVYDFFSINVGLSKAAEIEWHRKSKVLYLGYRDCGIKPSEKKSVNKIAYVGSLVPRKRPQYILDIAEKLPEIEFEIIGGGELKESLQNSITTRQIQNVTLVGKIENDEVYRRLSKCDLLVITSDNEGQPKVSLEAASLGLPTAYIGGNYSIDYIENNVTGYEAKDLDGLIEIIKKISKEDGEFSKVSENVRKATEIYSWDRLSAEYTNYFKNVYQKRHNAALHKDR